MNALVSNEIVDAIFEEPADNGDYAKYRAQCLLGAVKVALFGLLDKSRTGAALSEFEIVGLAEILETASDLIEDV